jgi:hypothetical protein
MDEYILLVVFTQQDANNKNNIISIKSTELQRECSESLCLQIQRDPHVNCAPCFQLCGQLAKFPQEAILSHYNSGVTP